MHLREPKELADNFLQALREHPLTEKSTASEIHKVELEFARLFALDRKTNLLAVKPEAAEILRAKLKEPELAQVEIIFRKGNLDEYNIKLGFGAFCKSIGRQQPIPPPPSRPAPPIPTQQASPPGSPKKQATHKAPQKPLPAVPPRSASDHEGYKGPKQFDNKKRPSSDGTNSTPTPPSPKKGT
jgi:hypothetical protein